MTKIQGHRITAKKGNQVIRRDTKNFKAIKQKQHSTQKSKGQLQKYRNDEVDMLPEHQPQVEIPREDHQNRQGETEPNHRPPVRETKETTRVRRSKRRQRTTNNYNAAKGK